MADGISIFGLNVSESWIAAASSMATVVAAFVAAFAWRLSMTTLKRTEQGLAADILLRLDAEMREHREVHEKLRPGGDWSTPACVPLSTCDWIKIEAYLGLFERIDEFEKQGLVSREYIRDFYGYRYENIIANSTIVCEKLVPESERWGHFYSLGKMLGCPVDVSICSS